MTDRARRPAGALGRPPFFLGATLLLFIILMFVVGCGDEEKVIRPEVPAGRIQGTVRTGMAISGMRISATRIPGASQSIFVGKAVPDYLGRFTLDVPAGRYLIGLEINDAAYYSYARSGLHYAGDPADTLLIDENHSLTGIDFDLAAVRIHMGVPPELNRESARVTLIRRGDDSAPVSYSPVNRGWAQAQNDSLTITVPCVIPGSYKMKMEVGYRTCSCIGYIYGGETFWLPATRDSTQSPWRDVPVDQITDVDARIDSRPARIEGEVVGAWQQMAIEDRPTVSLFSLDSMLVRGSWTADEDGAFGLDVYLPCDVKVRVWHVGFEQWIGGSTFETATSFSLEHGSTVSGVRLVQSGLAIDMQPDSIAFDMIYADVSIYDATTGRWVGRYSPSTGGGGTALLSIPNLTLGSYLLNLQSRYGRSEWLPQWFDRSSSRDGAQVIPILVEGEIVPVHMTLEMGGKISGTVQDRPGIEHLVYWTSADDPVAPDFVYAFDATYRVVGLPDGDYKVGAWRRTSGYPDQPPFGTVWYPSTMDWSAAQPIAIRNHVIVRGIDITIPH